MDNETLIHAVINTLQDLDIKPTCGNMEKLTGCIQALSQVLDGLKGGGAKDGGATDSQ